MFLVLQSNIHIQKNRNNQMCRLLKQIIVTKYFQNFLFSVLFSIDL